MCREINVNTVLNFNLTNVMFDVLYGFADAEAKKHTSGYPFYHLSHPSQANSVVFNFTHYVGLTKQRLCCCVLVKLQTVA